MGKERKLILTIGLPASGKTTWTKEFIEKNPGWMSISRDEFRFMLLNKPFLDFKGENLVSELLYASARKILRSGYNLILDNTHLKVAYINEAIERLGDMADIDYRYFDVPLETCLERDSRRTKQVGEAVIKRMHKDLKGLLDSFDWKPHKKREKTRPDYTAGFNPDLPYAIISDIDGTIAHMNGKRGPFDWKKVGRDDPDYPIIETLKAWKSYAKDRSIDLKLLMVSGRDGSCRAETIDWLTAAEVPFDELFMRKANDFRKDSLVKKEIYQHHLEGKYNIINVYDDRNQVVDLWRSLGLKCVQVEPGDF